MITRSATLAGAALLAGVSVIGVGATAVHAEPSEEVKVDPCLATLLVDSEDKSATITVICQETKTVGLELEADDLTLFSTQTVAANVSQSFTVALPPVPRVCLTLEVDDEDEEVCVSTELPQTPAPPEDDDDPDDEDDLDDEEDEEDED